MASQKIGENSLETQFRIQGRDCEDGSLGKVLVNQAEGLWILHWAHFFLCYFLLMQMGRAEILLNDAIKHQTQTRQVCACCAGQMGKAGKKHDKKK